jgi:hypothetical protein
MLYMVSNKWSPKRSNAGTPKVCKSPPPLDVMPPEPFPLVLHNMYDIDVAWGSTHYVGSGVLTLNRDSAPFGDSWLWRSYVGSKPNGWSAEFQCKISDRLWRASLWYLVSGITRLSGVRALGPPALPIPVDTGLFNYYFGAIWVGKRLGQVYV